MPKLAVALVLGLLVGALGSRWLASDPTASGVPSLEPLGPTVPERAPAVTAESPVTALADSDRSTAAPSDRAPSTPSDVLITDALRRYASEGIAKGWGAVRADEIPEEDLAEGMKSYEKLVLERPLEIGRSLGERRTKAEEALEDARTGGVFALLEKLAAGGVGPLPGLVRDPKQFEPLFQRADVETFRSGLANKDHPDADTADGVTLTWPAGVFLVKNLMKEKDPYPRDVTIAGAGIDATMLVLGSGDLMTRDSLRNFALRDCTVYTNDNYLFDLRIKPASIRFERVRFVGFDMGAGGSCLLAMKALALDARQCRFEGGYGRSPGSGTLFDVRSDAVVARFTGCTTSRLQMGIWRWREGATVLFTGCSFEEILDDMLGQAASKPGVLLDGCSVTRFEGNPHSVPQLDLNALFPDWKQRME